MSGASLPTANTINVINFFSVLIPDEWGKSSDSSEYVEFGAVFAVLIPDEWGKSSDEKTYTGLEEQDMS